MAPPPSHGPASAGDAALLAAFREGLGLPDLAMQSLTPGMMKLIGQMMRESTRGTVELLAARAALKREIRADVTMIAARENNPLKFSPNAETALRHLFGPTTQGYMPAQAAMRDAYDDLRAHQFGMMAGLRAALDGVLKRFDPGVLEGRLTQKSMLASLVPSSRKARLWELFNDLYVQLSAEAADDFHQLFGKAFLQAYEAHVDELHKGRP
jgi:FHA domain-containing protein